MTSVKVVVLNGYMVEKLSPSPTAIEKQIFGGISVQGPLSPIPDGKWVQGDDFGVTGDLPRVYANHAWVYAAINAISRNLSGVPLKVQVGSKKSPKDVDEETQGRAGELWRVLHNPNPIMTLSELVGATIIYQHLGGMCFWILDRNSITEIPKAILPVPRENMEPVFEPGNNFPLGWVFHQGGDLVPVRHEQLIVFRFFNPYDPIMGLSPLEAARQGIKLDFLAGLFGQGFFENNASPDAVIEYEKRIGKKLREELLETWEQRHRGPLNSKKIGILTGGGKYKATSISQKDMEFIKQREYTKSEILAVFKVPETEISEYEGVAHANAQSQDQAFWRKTIVPIGRNHESAIFKQLIMGLAPTIGRGLRIVYDFDSVESLQESKTEKINNAKGLYSIGFPINEINRVLKLGMVNVPWGDEWYPNRSVVPITDVIEGNVDNGPRSGPSESREPEKPRGNEEDEKPDKEEDQKKLRVYKTVFRRLFASILPSMQKDLGTYFYKLRTHQLRLIDSDRGVFKTSDWGSRLDTRLKSSHSKIGKVVLKLSESQGLVPSGTKLHGFLGKLHSALEVINSSDESKDKKKTMVRRVFNHVCSEEKLKCLCYLEMASVFSTTYKSSKGIGNEEES